MKKFRIAYGLTNSQSFSKQIALLPEVHGSSVLTCTSAHISIYMNGKLITSERVVDRNFTFNAWLLYFCPDLAVEVSKIADGAEHKVFVLTDSGYISFQKENSLVKVKWVENTKSETTLTDREFLTEILNFLNSFLDNSLLVNQQVLEFEPYQKIVEGRNKIKEMIEGLK